MKRAKVRMVLRRVIVTAMAAMLVATTAAGTGIISYAGEDDAIVVAPANEEAEPEAPAEPKAEEPKAPAEPKAEEPKAPAEPEVDEEEPAEPKEETPEEGIAPVVAIGAGAANVKKATSEPEVVEVAAEKPLPKVQNVRLEGDVLLWDPFDGADYYVITSRGQGFSEDYTNITTMDLAERYEMVHLGAGTYGVTVRAIGKENNFISEESDVIPYTYIEPSEKIVITFYDSYSDNEFLPVIGEKVSLPSIISYGASCGFESCGWEKYVSDLDTWATYDADTFEAGTYRYKAKIYITDPYKYSYKLGDGLTVWVGREKWAVEGAVNDEWACIVSPSYEAVGTRPVPFNLSETEVTINMSENTIFAPSKYMTVSNMGDKTLTFDYSISNDYVRWDWGDEAELIPSNSTYFYLTPKSSLSAGTYSSVVTVTGKDESGTAVGSIDINVTIVVKSGGSIIELKEIVKTVDVTSDISDIAANGNQIKPPTLTCSNQKLNVDAVRWLKYSGERWEEMDSSDTFTPGTYKFVIFVGIKYDFRDNAVLDNNVEVMVDGQAWTLSARTDESEGDLLGATFLSPDIVIEDGSSSEEKIISRIEVTSDISDILVIGEELKAPSFKITNGAEVRIFPEFWMWDQALGNDKGVTRSFGEVIAPGNYKCYILVSPKADYRISEDVKLIVDGKEAENDTDYSGYTGGQIFFYTPAVEAKENTTPIEPETLEFDNDNLKYELGSGVDLEIRCTGKLDDFRDLLIDGVYLDSGDHYSVRSGSTIATIKSAYLDTLAEGDHTVTFNYSEGRTASTVLKVEKENQIQQDDNNNNNNNSNSNNSNSNNNSNNNTNNNTSSDNSGNQSTEPSYTAPVAAVLGEVREAPAGTDAAAATEAGAVLGARKGGTEDAANPAGRILLMLVSALGIAVITCTSKKTNKN